MTKFLPLSALLLLTACQTVSDEPRLMVADRLTWDTVPIISASGLTPNTSYTLEVERVGSWDENVTARSETVYMSDARGRIDTSKQMADGDDELSPYVPIRTMGYVEEPLTDLEPGLLRMTLFDGAGEAVVEKVSAIGPDTNDLVETPLGDDFVGAFVLSQSGEPTPRPTIIYLGGSEGGDGSARATGPILAAQGYTVLGLPYYSPAWFGNEATFPELPRSFAHLPVDYLEDAVKVLRQRPDVDPERILLFGVSKGAEYVLLAGSLIPDDSPGGGFCGIVANVPTDVVWEGWGTRPDSVAEGEAFSGFSWRGEPLPFVPYENIDAGINPNDDYTLAQSHADGREVNPDRVAPARIAVERIDEPVFVTGGDKDTVWPSGPMTRTIRDARTAAGLTTEAFVYPEGGHSVSGTPLRRGALADTQARLETFPATMAFLKRHSERDDCRD